MVPEPFESRVIRSILLISESGTVGIERRYPNDTMLLIEVREIVIIQGY